MGMIEPLLDPSAPELTSREIQAGASSSRPPPFNPELGDGECEIEEAPVRSVETRVARNNARYAIHLVYDASCAHRN